MAKFVSYKNYFLIAAPNMLDPTFARTVVYLCEHTESGAMGIVINRTMALSVANLLERLDIESQSERLHSEWLYDGGPVQMERGFVLHSPYQIFHSTLQVSDQVMLSTSRDVLEAIGGGETSPDKFLVSLGYSGWSAGQLEDELTANGWLLAPADESIIFDIAAPKRYEAALALLVLTDSGLEGWTKETGHA